MGNVRGNLDNSCLRKFNGEKWLRNISLIAARVKAGMKNSLLRVVIKIIDCRTCKHYKEQHWQDFCYYKGHRINLLDREYCKGYGKGTMNL